MKRRRDDAGAEKEDGADRCDLDPFVKARGVHGLTGFGLALWRQRMRGLYAENIERAAAKINPVTENG